MREVGGQHKREDAGHPHSVAVDSDKEAGTNAAEEMTCKIIIYNHG